MLFCHRPLPRNLTIISCTIYNRIAFFLQGNKADIWVAFFPPFDLSEQVNHSQPVYKPWGLPYGGMPPVGRARGSLQTSFTLDLTVILYYVSPKFPEAWFLLSRADRSLDHPAGAANSSCVQLSAAAPTANLGLTLRAVERCYQNTWWIFLCVSFGAGVRQTVFFRKVFP